MATTEIVQWTHPPEQTIRHQRRTRLRLRLLQPRAQSLAVMEGEDETHHSVTGCNGRPPDHRGVVTPPRSIPRFPHVRRWARVSKEFDLSSDFPGSSCIPDYTQLRGTHSPTQLPQTPGSTSCGPKAIRAFAQHTRFFIIRTCIP